MDSLRDHQLHLNPSYAYNYHEQDRAISSVKNQVSIANDAMKSATSELTIRTNALTMVVNNYFNQLNELSMAHSSSSLPTTRISNNVNHKFQNSEVISHKNNLLENYGSSSSSSSASIDNMLVSLKSNVGIIYSLVNKKSNSNY